MKVYIEDGCKGITPPAYPGDAGYDLYASHDMPCSKGAINLIRTGVHVEIPEGYVGLVLDRSSMAKLGFFSVGGVIDSGYRGEIIVGLHASDQVFAFRRYMIAKNDKIAQLVVVPCHTAFEKVDHLDALSASVRGDRGFGSTDIPADNPEYKLARLLLGEDVTPTKFCSLYMQRVQDGLVKVEAHTDVDVVTKYYPVSIFLREDLMEWLTVTASDRTIVRHESED